MTQTKQIPEDPDFIVQLHFSAAAKEYLALEAGPPTGYGAPPDLLRLQHVQTGDFLRLQGIPKAWAVQYRTWVVMDDQLVLKLILDGPIEPD